MTDPRTPADAGSRLFGASVLVVGQNPELVDGTPVYAISDRGGARIGSVADVGRRDLSRATHPDRLRDHAASAATETPAPGFAAAFARLSSVARRVSYRLEVRDAQGVALLVLTSAEWDERSLITVGRADGVVIGTITRQNMLLRKPRYALVADGQPVGTIVADQRYSVHHHVLDAEKHEVARIAPRHGRLARALAREPPSFAVQLSLPLPDPLHRLVLAGALTADTALKRTEPSDP